MVTLNSIYSNKRILITGNTGFKGSWLVAWLVSLGAKVHGVSNGVPTEPSLFRSSKQADRAAYSELDIRDYMGMEGIVREVQPEFLFHLAAQPIVRESYTDPLSTIATNGMGTANILEALRVVNPACTAVFVTSDKAYDNVEWIWGYRESDALGGKDPYSASKGMAELAIKTYAQSFFNSASSRVKVGVGRAGNVIGGGDWAADRIVPDAIRAWVGGSAVQVRNPDSTRPWQHVLEPLSGYLLLGAHLAVNPALNGEAFNFGPNADQNKTVRDLLEEMEQFWPGSAWADVSANEHKHEAKLLKLNCDKALHYLKWKPALTFTENCRLTTEWYRRYYDHPEKAWELTVADIEAYSALAKERDCGWE